MSSWRGRVYFGSLNLFFFPSLQPGKEKKNLLSHTQLQSSSLPPVRNPFKAPDMKDSNCVGRKKCGEKEQKRKEGKEPNPKAEGTEIYQKENEKHVVSEVEGKEEGKLNSSEMYQGKHLPQGMKLKKKVSSGEQNSPKVNDVEKIADTFKDRRVDDTESEEAEKIISTTKVNTIHSEKVNQTEQNPQKETVSKSSHSSRTQASMDSDNISHHMSDRPPHSTVSNQTGRHPDNDEEDVVLVSVKPAAQKTPPVSTVQKTLTAFPGFQPASKIKSQDDPQGLRGLLTTQLHQKKVSLKGISGWANLDFAANAPVVIGSCYEAILTSDIYYFFTFHYTYTNINV